MDESDGNDTGGGQGGGGGGCSVIGARNGMIWDEEDGSRWGMGWRWMGLGWWDEGDWRG